MRLDRRLNFVIPIEQDGKTVYVHSMPISRDVFERYAIVIAKTFAAIYNEGLGIIAGPRVAAHVLKKVAVASGEWDGESGVARGLMAEIRRLSNVLVPGAKGWETVPLEDAIKRGMIDPEDASEVENAVVFFCVASSMHKRAELKAVLDGASMYWGARVESSNCTEFAASLPTSTAGANTGGTSPPASAASTIQPAAAKVTATVEAPGQPARPLSLPS
jgi:hypothetical protein